jgi:toxin ParE1/3/4
MPPPNYSPEADADIVDLNIYGMLTYGIAHTDAYVARLRRAIALHAENPLAAAERDEIRPPIRMFRCGAHHVFYDVIDGQILVQRVLHHSVDWANAL